MIFSLSGLITAQWTIKAVAAAVRMKLFTQVSDHILSLEELASKCGTEPRLIKPLLDACVSMGLLNMEGGKFKNSHFTQMHLVEGGLQYVGDLIKLQDREVKKWDTLHELFLKDDQNVETIGAPESDHETFIKAMNNLGLLGEAKALADALDLSGYTSMIDAGGGSGLYSVFLCRKYPSLRITILDRKEILPITESLIARKKERERITLREANITTDAFGKEIDAVLLSDIIYHREEAKKILKNCWDCLRKDGLLILRGYYSDPENTRPLFGAVFALNQLAFDHSREILTLSQLKKEVGESGFKINKSIRLTERSYLITAYKKTY